MKTFGAIDTMSEERRHSLASQLIIPSGATATPRTNSLGPFERQTLGSPGNTTRDNIYPSPYPNEGSDRQSSPQVSDDNQRHRSRRSPNALSRSAVRPPTPQFGALSGYWDRYDEATVQFTEELLTGLKDNLDNLLIFVREPNRRNTVSHANI